MAINCLKKFEINLEENNASYWMETEIHLHANMIT